MILPCTWILSIVRLGDLDVLQVPFIWVEPLPMFAKSTVLSRISYHVSIIVASPLLDVAGAVNVRTGGVSGQDLQLSK